MSHSSRNQLDAAIIIGGLAWVLITGVAFVAFPTYQLLDRTVVRRPFWAPPSVVVREAGQGLSPADIARMEQDPQQQEQVAKLKQPIIFQPSPSWLGHDQPAPLKPASGRRLPPNGLLYLFILSLAGYICALKYRGIL